MNYAFVSGISRGGLAFLVNEAGVKMPVKITEITSDSRVGGATEYKCEEVYLWPKENPHIKKNPQLAVNVTIKKVIFNDPATIVFWSDGTKTVVKTQNDEPFDPEKGLAMAMAKRAFGNKGSYYNHIRKWVDKYEEDAADELIFDFQEAIEKITKSAGKKPMTFREKLQKERPEMISPRNIGGCFGCPIHFGYEHDRANCPCDTNDDDGYPKPNNDACTACWDRVIPNEGEKK